MPEQSHQAEHILTAREESKVEEAFSGLAGGHATVHAPGPAASGLRWTDVPAAIVYACDEAQMAVCSTTRHEWGYEVNLKTVEDYPAVLMLRRLDGPGVYEARASVGLFNDHPDRAEELLNALDRQMRAFGKKRQYND